MSAFERLSDGSQGSLTKRQLEEIQLAKVKPIVTTHAVARLPDGSRAPETLRGADDEFIESITSGWALPIE